MEGSAPLSASEIYQGCRTPSIHSVFSASSSEPFLTPSSTAREFYEGLRTPDSSTLSVRSDDANGVDDGEYHIYTAINCRTIFNGTSSLLVNDFNFGLSSLCSEIEGESPPPGVSIDGSESFAARRFTYLELAAGTNNFSPDCLLGQGEFGRVYKGRLEITGQVVAIEQYNSGTERNQSFLYEASKRSPLDHPNIVSFIGHCADGNQRLMVSEYMPLGSLEYHLYHLPFGRKYLDWNTRMRITAGVAKGLEYLHDKLKPPLIVHPLKCSNILLGEGYHPKLSDLGLVKHGFHGDISSTLIGTPSYCAREYLQRRRLTLKSDIYSFGVVLLEIITGIKQSDIRNVVGWDLLEWLFKVKFNQIADPNLKGQYPMNSLYHALCIVAMCIQELPIVRPHIGELVKAFTFLSSEQYAPDV